MRYHVRGILTALLRRSQPVLPSPEILVPEEEVMGTNRNRRLHLNIGKHFCTVRVTEHWHRLS